MQLAHAAVWGLIGGLVVEALDLSTAIRRTGGWPWNKPGEPGTAAALIAVVLRVAAGTGLAAVAGNDNLVSSGFQAFALGVTAPLVVERISRNLAVSVKGHDDAS